MPSVPPLLRVDVQPVDEATYRLALEGELDVHSADLLRSIGLGACNDGRTLILDLVDLTFVDSTGLGTIAQLQKRCTAGGGELVVTNVPDTVARMLEITGLDKYLRTVDPD